ncbi:MAG: hypothetical protein IKJ89_07130, partial [Kiritimatiellae bacterium]|nr:hypothetical protein [Kiritimatiellia bacterium]
MATGCNGRIVGLASLGVAVMVGAPVSTHAGSAGPDGTDYVVSADANEEFVVEAAIDGYARVVKKGAGKVRLTTTTESYAGDVVIEEGALYLVTVGQDVHYLNGALTGSGTGSSQIFRKQGSGTLYVNGNVDLPRDVQIDQGLLVMTSTASRVFGNSFVLKGGSRSMVGGGHALFNTIYVGPDSNYGVFHQTGGLLGVTGETSVGGNKNTTGAGHWMMSGGEAYVSNNVYVAYDAGNFGSFIQAGGLFKLDGGALRASRAGTAVFHLAGGTNDTRVVRGETTVRFYLSDYGGSSDVTVSGAGTLLATETLRLGGGGGTVSTNVFSVKDGATVKAARFFKHRAAGAAALITVNADGGTLMPTMGYDWTNGSQNDANYYTANPSHFVIWKKGLVIDTSESTGNNPASHMPFSFAAPTGNGVESITLPTEGDYTTANYIGPARIVFEDETGWGASAYAEYDFETKRHTRVVLTSRGCDYSDNAKAYVESPDRTTRWECALTLSDNAGLGGELVKRGTHDLHLYATNTFYGIAVESGTLCAETDGVVPSNTSVRVEYGATLRFPTSAPLVLSSFAGAGSVPGCEITVTKSLRAKCADLFAGKHADIDGDLTFAPGATFTITDPENLAAYKRCKAAVAFSALHVNGEPTLAFEGKPTGSARWTLSRLDDS